MTRLSERKSPFHLEYPVMGLAILAWVVALALSRNPSLIVWDDLRTSFLNAAHYLTIPYNHSGFFAAPWANLFLLPFSSLSVPLAALVSTLLYFGLLALVIRKNGGGRLAILVTLSSVLALDAVIEMNIDWIVCIGLFVPARFSLPFLMVKPQAVFGYLFSFSRADFVKACTFGVVVLLVSFLIWGFWLADVYAAIQRDTLNAPVNIAPLALIGPASILIGVVLMIFGSRHKDALVCTAAGVCLVPYIAPTSILILFALFASRHPCFALLISVVLWAVTLLTVIPFWVSI